ncbi:MAG: hypothetical protein PHQ23_08705, partial [Candidatus Wallbacteria bacterium]|nr:hypothetical protein [Candidatus Wallbacteria bacterium]
LVNFDNASKLFSLSGANASIGIVTYGMAAIGLRTAHSFMTEFEATLPLERLPVRQVAECIGAFFNGQWLREMPEDFKGPDMTFVVAGFDEDEPYGKVYQVDIPHRIDPVEKNAMDNEFGMVWGGQREYVDRLIQGFDPRLPGIVMEKLKLKPAQMDDLMAELRKLQMMIPLQAMPLQDCVDLAVFAVQTTIDAQRLSVGMRACGGPVDVAVITRRDGFRFIRCKELG